jgi:hypothetical protein
MATLPSSDTSGVDNGIPSQSIVRWPASHFDWHDLRGDRDHRHVCETDHVVQQQRIESGHRHLSQPDWNWRRFELQTLEAADVLDDGQTMLLEAGDLLLAETTSANSVDFTVSGVEET